MSYVMYSCCMHHNRRLVHKRQLSCLAGFESSVVSVHCRLTNPVGLQMSELSVDPRLAKAILASAGQLACSQEVVTIVAMLSVHSVWAGAHGERKAQNEAKLR